MAVKRGAQVEATDGPVGQVDELLINSNNMQVTHLVVLERHLLETGRSQSLSRRSTVFMRTRFT